MLFRIEFTDRQRDVFAGCLFVTLSVAYALLTLDRGWIPHDEGQLGQTAERILLAELPHRDFVDPYTGGLGYMHALAFRMFGVHSESLRYASIPFLAAFAGCLFWMAKRVAANTVAGLITFLGTCFTLPIYPAPMPSWFNLFFATYGAAVLLLFVDSKQKRWLFLAGVCGGCSILMKITGLYFVAAGLLFLAFYEHLQQPNGHQVRAPMRWGYPVFATSMLFAFSCLICKFVRAGSPAMDIAHFVMPCAALAGIQCFFQWYTSSEPFLIRARRIVLLAFPFLGGITIVLGGFVLYYATQQALPELLQGVFVLPQQRLTNAEMPFPEPRWLLVSLPLATPLFLGLSHRKLESRTALLFIPIALAALLWATGREQIYAAIFQAFRQTTPWIVLAGVLTIGSSGGKNRHLEVYLLCAVAALASLIQYPYSGGFYFFYTAPLSLLAAVHVTAAQPRAPRAILLSMLLFATGFLVLRMHFPGPAVTGGPYRPDTPVQSLNLDRCNLTVSSNEAVLYHLLINHIQSVAQPNQPVYAAPDCPEVYFLSDRQNPSGVMYDFFSSAEAGASSRIGSLIRDGIIRVAVINQSSEFTSLVDASLMSTIVKQLPHKQSFYMQSESGPILRFVVYSSGVR